MSAYSDYKVTGDQMDMETFRTECEAGERWYCAGYDEEEQEEDK